MDSSDLHRLFSILLVLFGFTSSHIVRRIENETMWNLRIQRKLILRLGFRPKAHNLTYMEHVRNNLPYPISRRINRENSPLPTLPPDSDREVMAIGEPAHRCLDRMASACFIFRITDDLTDLKEAILWLDLRVDNNFIGRTVSIHEVKYLDSNIQVKDALGPTIRVGPQRANRESIARDITNILKLWGRQARLLNLRSISRAIAIICTDCNFQGISPVKDDRIIMELTFRRRSGRFRRSGHRHQRHQYMNECGSIPINCCLQPYTLNFRRVGWDNWVVYPLMFTPNYCMGSCDGNVLPETQHASMLTAAVRGMENLSSRQRNAMLPCCAPTSMGSFTLMYLDNGGKVRLNQMHNLVAFNCGCM